MTEPAPVATIASSVDARLDQLCALRSGLSAQLAEIAPQVKEISDQLKLVNETIKVELARLAPGQAKVRLDSAHLGHSLVMSNKVRRSVVNPEQFRAEQPELYGRFVNESAYYDLREVK